MKTIKQPSVFAMLMIMLFLLPRIASGEIFKCVKDGQVSYSSAPCLSGNIFYYGKRVPAAEPPAKSVTVSRGSDGLYSLPGSVNGMSTTFIIDTGSNTTTISGEFAYRLGLDSCMTVGTASTANGDALVCRVTVASLSVGGLNFENVALTVTLAMKVDALLGNDLLSRFKVNQQAGVMILSK